MATKRRALASWRGLAVGDCDNNNARMGPAKATQLMAKTPIERQRVLPQQFESREMYP
jgi:hypothetical protein